MAVFERSVLGLDLGSHSLKAAEIKISPRSLEPGAFRSQMRADAEAPWPAQLERFLSSSHSSSRASSKAPAEQIVCALPVSQLSTRRLDFPFSDTRRLDQAVPFEIEAETPFDLDDVFIDWNLISGDRGHGAVAATLTKRTHVENLLGALAEANCEPQVLEAEGLVLANLAPIFELKGTQLIIDIGHAKTTFCAVVEGRALLARTTPAAGRAMTEAMVAESGLAFEDAEAAKHEGGALNPAGPSAGVLAIVDRIAREAMRTLEAAEARDGDRVVAREAEITLVGGGALLDRIDEVLAKRTGLQVARLRMPADAPHASLVQGTDAVVMAPALALALRFSGEAAGQLDFRQGEFAYRQNFTELFGRELRPTLFLAAGLAGLLLLSALTTVVLQHRRESRQQTAAIALYRDAFPDRSAVPEKPAAALGSELRAAQERAEFLGLYSGDRSALVLLAELSRAIPSDLAVRITEVNIDRNTIRLDVDAEGYEAADRLTEVLAETAPFEGAKVAGSVKTDRRSGGVSFNVSIPLAAGTADGAGFSGRDDA